MNQPIGIYIHVPFCQSKCNYCDFYSLDSADKTAYVHKIKEQLFLQGQTLNRTADTIYIGGGTPTLLPPEALAGMIGTAKSAFSFKKGEVTVEANPAENLRDCFRILAQAGVNRVSIGLQSANEAELRLLGRRHSPKDVQKTIFDAKSAGIQNISVDVIFGLPDQTTKHLAKTLRFVETLDISHISAYILKIEPGTPFFKQGVVPAGDDQAADLYLFACEQIESMGFAQYEISNFSRPNMESKHNLKYWNGQEYLGLGPSAHSFLNGKRFRYPCDYAEYLKAPTPVPDGDGGSFEEQAMLKLRLTKGLKRPIPPEYLERARPFESAGLLRIENGGIKLTKQGFLVSNQLIPRILFD